MSNFARIDITALTVAARFFNVMQHAGADFSGPMKSPTKRANLVAFLKLGCPKLEVTSESVHTVPARKR